MEEINVEKLKDRLYSVSKALFMISETLVDESKLHISAEDAIKKIRSYMYDTDVIGSRYRVNKLIDECSVEQVYNWFEDYGKTYLKVNGFDYPDCCDGCSNNPKNGGCGICNCTLPYMQNPNMYATNTSIDDYCMTSTTSTGAYIVGKEKPEADKQPKADSSVIADAVERTKKYIRKQYEK